MTLKTVQKKGYTPDISNITEPVSTGIWNIDCIDCEASSVDVRSGYAYVASDDGLWILDVRDASAPTTVGHFDTAGIPFDVAVADHYAYVAEGGQGLRVLDVHDPAAPVSAGYYSTSGWAYGVAVDGALVCVADYNYLGLYDCSAAVGAGEPEPSVMPQTFALWPAYPNPFNATTQIRFEVPRAARVELAVYDLQGRLVEALATEVFAAGSHEVRVEAGDWGSGVYFVRMVSGGFVQAQKVLLVK